VVSSAGAWEAAVTLPPVSARGTTARRLLLLPTLLASAAGCDAGCGRYATQTGWMLGEVTLDGDRWFERCGPEYGTTGALDLLGDGRAWIDFAPAAHDRDADWAAVALDMELFVPIDELLVLGAHVVDATGGARITDSAGNHFAEAPLTSAVVDVVAVRDGDEPCTPFRSQEVRLTWDVAWGSPDDEVHYAASGTDWIRFLVDESSADSGCL
jgi:hypothetical protein